MKPARDPPRRRNDLSHRKRVLNGREIGDSRDYLQTLRGAMMRERCFYQSTRGIEFFCTAKGGHVDDGAVRAAGSSISPHPRCIRDIRRIGVRVKKIQAAIKSRSKRCAAEGRPIDRS